LPSCWSRAAAGRSPQVHVVGSGAGRSVPIQRRRGRDARRSARWRAKTGAAGASTSVVKDHVADVVEPLMSLPPPARNRAFLRQRSRSIAGSVVLVASGGGDEVRSTRRRRSLRSKHSSPTSGSAKPRSPHCLAIRAPARRQWRKLLSSTVTSLLCMAMARSGLPSPLRSATATKLGRHDGLPGAAVNPPLRCPEAPSRCCHTDCDGEVRLAIPVEVPTAWNLGSFYSKRAAGGRCERNPFRCQQHGYGVVVPICGGEVQLAISVKVAHPPPNVDRSPL